MFDLRDVITGLRRDIGYAATVVFTLALTIGATTAVFSIVNGVLLRPLAYREAHRLVAIRDIYRQIEHQYPTLPVNPHHFEEWRAHAQSFDALTEFLVSSANLSGGGTPRQIVVVRAAGRLFDVMAVRPALGRPLGPDDERKEAPDVVVISDALWRERFHADPSVLGRPAILDGSPYIVAGVLPAEFRLPEPAAVMSTAMVLSRRVDAIVPLRLDLDGVSWAGEFNYTVLGRLRRDVPVAQARADLDVIQHRVSAIASDREHEPVTLGAFLLPLDIAVAGTSRRGLLLLLGAIAAVLLIACSNLANLSLTRTMGRLRDAAIRVALGASRERLLARVLLEQVLLAAAGGALAVGVAAGALAAFVRTAPAGLPRVDEVSIDARVLLFGGAVTLIAGLVIALLPAWRVAGRDVQGALRATTLAVSTDRRGLQMRAVLLATQIALSVTLLIVTALLGISFYRLLHVDRGFDTGRVITATIAFPASRYEEAEARVAAYDRTLAAVRALPAVESVSWVSLLPTRGEGWVDLVNVPGETRPVFERPNANYRFIGPDFFNVTSTPILEGRPFTALERDSARPLPALVSARLASIVWPGQDAIGQEFTRGDPLARPFQVVGVVADARITALDRIPPPVVYVPYWARSASRASLMVRVRTLPSTFANELRRALATVDPDAAVGDVQTLDEVVDASLASRRYEVRLFVAFGLVALAIALVGVYGVTVYGVSRRRREMNIRVALGAQPSEVRALIVRHAGWSIVAGLITGAAAAAAAGGAVAALLFEVKPSDPFVIASVVSMVGVAGLGASLIAARLNLSIDPAAALREE